MRTQFFFAGLLSVVAGGLVGTAGCDDITAGQPTDSSAPPQLQHVMIQDARYLFDWPNRASALDILDNNQAQPCTIASPATATDPQVDTCINEFLVDQVAPDVTCTAAGICNDPLKIPATGVPVPQPQVYVTGVMDMRDPGGGIQIRLVFDKALDSSIETVTIDPSKAPGSTNTYALAGIVELDDQAGMPVASVIYLDNGGSSIYSSDLELVPFGSAIVIKPKTTLDAASTYTVKILNPGAIKDREGNAAVGLGGGALPTSFTFKTEDLTPNSGGTFGGGTPAAVGLDYPDFFDATADMPATIAANEVVQISFFENIAGDMAVVTPTTVPAGAQIVAFGERFNDPTACPMFASGDPGGNSLDIVNADLDGPHHGDAGELAARRLHDSRQCQGHQRPLDVRGRLLLHGHRPVDRHDGSEHLREPPYPRAVHVVIAA